MFIINGQFNDFISVRDRGLHYGDGVFETIALQGNTPLCWELHYQRLKSGCERLGINCPSDSLLLSELAQFQIESELSVFKIIITRGQGGRGYRLPDADTPTTRILGLYPWPEYPDENYSEGIKTAICRIRLGHNPYLAGIKHLNRLEQVLASSEYNQPDIAEYLMMDKDENIIEGSMSNLFMVTNNTLVTPDISNCGINGIVRQHILGLAPLIGLSARITSITKSDLYNADELFLCNSVIGIWVIRKIGEHEYNAGPWTEMIRNKLIEEKIIVR